MFLFSPSAFMLILTLVPVSYIAFYVACRCVLNLFLQIAEKLEIVVIVWF